MRTPTTHPLNVSHLVVGLVFLGLSGSWALRTAGLVDTRDVGWLLPVVLVAAGVAGLAAFAFRGIGRGRRHGTDDMDDMDDTDAITLTRGTWPDDGPNTGPDSWSDSGSDRTHGGDPR